MLLSCGKFAAVIEAKALLLLMLTMWAWQQLVHPAEHDHKVSTAVATVPAATEAVEIQVKRNVDAAHR